MAPRRRPTGFPRGRLYIGWLQDGDAILPGGGLIAGAEGETKI